MSSEQKMVKVTEVTTTTRTEWTRSKSFWQLPCGCIGPDIWSSEEAQQAECTECGRGWWHMGVRGNVCVMLDGEPQGEPKVIST